MRKRILIAAVVVVVVAAGVWGYLAQRDQNGEVVVQVEEAARRTIVQTVVATGKIEPVTQVNISADVSAKIVRLEVDEGDWVEKGKLLLELDRERHLAAVESAEANLGAAEAQANLARENMIRAEKDFERTKQLFEEDLESQSIHDSMYAASQVEKARHQASLEQVQQAQAALKQVRDDLSKTTIFAPMDGTISQLNKEIGEICLGSQFQEDVILVISNLSGMEALVDVDENDIVSVSLVDTAEIEIDAIPGIVLEGEVTEIANSANITGAGSAEQKTEFEVKVRIVDPDSRLRPGMTATAEISTDRREEALSVPIQSVAVRTLEQLEVEEDEGLSPDKDGFVQLVWVVNNGAAEARQVETGIQGDDFIEIVDGLDEGESVVVGSFRAISRDLSPGLEVQIGEEEAEDDQGGN